MMGNWSEEARVNFARMLPTLSVVCWTQYESGKRLRLCMRCLMFVDYALKADETVYSRRQAARYDAIPEDQKCKHLKKVNL
jgi:hypothetical protein